MIGKNIKKLPTPKRITRIGAGKNKNTGKEKSSEARVSRIEIKGKRLKEDWLTSEVVNTLATAEADILFNKMLGGEDKEKLKNAKLMIIDLAKQVSTLEDSNKKMNAKVEYYRSEKNFIRMLEERHRAFGEAARKTGEMLKLFGETYEKVESPSTTLFDREFEEGSQEAFNKQVEALFGDKVDLPYSTVEQEVQKEDFPWDETEVGENSVVPTVSELKEAIAPTVSDLEGRVEKIKEDLEYKLAGGRKNKSITEKKKKRHGNKNKKCKRNR